MKKIITLLFLFIIPTAQGMLEPPDPQTIDDLPTYCTFLVEQLDQQKPIERQRAHSIKKLQLCSTGGRKAHMGRIIHLLSLLTETMLSPEERLHHWLIHDYQAATIKLPESDYGIYIVPATIPKNKISYDELIPLYAAQLENLKQGWMPTDLACHPEIRFKLDEKEWMLFVKEKNEHIFELTDKLIRYFNLIDVVRCFDTMISKHPLDFCKSPTTMYLWVKKTAFNYVAEILKFNLGIKPGMHDAATQTLFYSVDASTACKGAEDEEFVHRLEDTYEH